MAKRKKNTPKFTQIRANSLHEFANLLIAHFGDLNKVPWSSAYTEHEFDYSGCYYEGDEPSVDLVFVLTVEEKINS